MIRYIAHIQSIVHCIIVQQMVTTITAATTVIRTIRITAIARACAAHTLHRGRWGYGPIMTAVVAAAKCNVKKKEKQQRYTQLKMHLITKRPAIAHRAKLIYKFRKI